MNKSRLLAFALAMAAVAPAFAGDVKVVKQIAPVYPVDALRSGTSGYVDLEVDIAAGGAVKSVSVLQAKPARVFEKNAVTAVKKWEFASAEGGKTKLRVDFKN